MTITDVPVAVVATEVTDSRPPWVARAFAGMYLDTAALPTTTATVLATDEDWDWIAAHENAVATATTSVLDDASAIAPGQWLVHSHLAACDLRWLVATTNGAAPTARGVGQVVLVARSATLATAHADRATPQ